MLELISLVHYLCKKIKINGGESDFVVDSRETGHWQGFQPIRPESRRHIGFQPMAVIRAS
jgi:hypothetical protein